ncbi:MAG: HipA domain-containing protein [Firmicutes bacterium]|nr:HipA domain-containing protein [Bacillota bacterium]MBQ9059520.1 HipA domain-containing protein [Bacillota bacterium]
MDYDIMCGDKKIAEYAQDRLHPVDDRLLPMFLRSHSFIRWVEQRAIDGDRTNARMLKKAHGMNRTSPDFETAMKYHAATITDNFWVKEASESITWDEVRFTDDIYFRMAISSDDSAFARKPSRTPELTNIGSREKGWRLIDGRWWLYKKDEFPEHELVAYQIGRLMGFDMAVYELQDGLIRTQDFTGGRMNLQHMDALTESEDYAENYRLIRQLSPEDGKRYLDIICLDTIINNPDRHTKNYGFLTSQTDGSILRFAPNYDNDMALYGVNQPWFEFTVSNQMMEEFIVFCEKESVRYTVPQLQPEAVREICSCLMNGDEIAEYIINRRNALAGSIAPE